jgi:hypothetical protein
MKTNMLTPWLVSLGRKCDRGKDPEVTKWTTVQDHRKKQTPEKQQISFHFSHSCKDLANFELRVVSTLAFHSYTLRLFRKGAKRELEEEDLYEVLSKCKASKLGDRMEQEWEKQKEKGKKNSILRLVIACYGVEIFLLGLTQLVEKIAVM